MTLLQPKLKTNHIDHIVHIEEKLALKFILLKYMCFMWCQKTWDSMFNFFRNSLFRDLRRLDKLLKSPMCAMCSMWFQKTWDSTCNFFRNSLFRDLRRLDKLLKSPMYAMCSMWF